MDSFDLLVVNGLVVTASDTANYDIAVKNGKIVLLAPPGFFAKDKASRVIDANGGYVMVQNSSTRALSKLTEITNQPGGIDCHVHLEEPALFGGKGRSSDNFETGTNCPRLPSEWTILIL